MLHMRQQGYRPDLIIGHVGWGEMLGLAEVFADTPSIGYCEYYYRAVGGDLNFDPEFGNSNPLLQTSLDVRNWHLLQSLQNCTVGICPTAFQADLFPAHIRPNLKVIHDGIDTTQLNSHKLPSTITLATSNGQLTLSRGQEIITFINRNLEPMRGYHQFMRALPAILAARPQAQVVLIGGDGHSYGGAAPMGTTYKELYLNEVRSQLDMTRVHFTGQIPYSALITLLAIGSAHVYLTYPFVLSWSMLEAMSVGALVIGSRTAPVQEVISHGDNGLLVDFFDPEALAEQVIAVLAAPADYTQIRQNARAHMVAHYDYTQVCLPAHVALMASVSGLTV
jgi:glycosyltransferase involved in cell wall biosynthesis